MSDVESIVGRAVFEAGVKMAGPERARLVRAVLSALRENAQIVRMEMEHEVWGMVK